MDRKGEEEKNVLRIDEFRERGVVGRTHAKQGNEREKNKEDMRGGAMKTCRE